MPDEPALPFRVLRRGLKAASRAGSSVVERVLRHDAQLGPPPTRERRAGIRPAEPGPLEVRFGPATAKVRAGTTLLEAARAAGVDLRHYCGGNCSCGTCRVEIRRGERNLSRREGMEEMVLGADRVRAGDRLACQAEVVGDVEVRIPDWF
jgi:ferredoxin